jgi:MFS family permease
LGGEASNVFPIILVVGGTIGVTTVTLGLRRVGAEVKALRLDRRGIGAALAVGMAVGFAQAVPLMLLPVVFEYPLGYGTLFAIFAIAPFAIALFLAGPVSGVLIRKFGPRGIMTVGTLSVGLANLLLALVLVGITGFVREFYRDNPDESHVALDVLHYALFILPLILIGAGFVLATTVRTAIVFASTPRGLPGSAAAINEASVGLGSRIGIVAATTALAAAAIGSARDMAERGQPERVETLVSEFELTLVALGTPRFREVYAATLEGADAVKGAAYSVAYMDGVTVALVLSGVVGLVGAAVAWLLIGRRDPLETVFDMQDERDDDGVDAASTATDTATS